MQRGFFDHVLDAFEGFSDDGHGEVHAAAHGRGLKVWFGTTDGRSAKEHYEAQLIRIDGSVSCEIGFHAEHRDPARNDAVLSALLAEEPAWRDELGPEAEAGGFLGMDGWIRISEVWDPPDPDDPDAPMEIAARLADYVDAIEPVRRSLAVGD